jgi:hypothetical protein
MFSIDSNSPHKDPRFPYHRFVNTTPKPNATKKRSGELDPPLLLLPLPLEPVVLAAGGAAEVEVDISVG